MRFVSRAFSIVLSRVLGFTMTLARRLVVGARQLVAPRRSLGVARVDCSCFFTNNFYVREPLEGHFEFVDRTSFARDNAAALGALAREDRERLFLTLEAEGERRRSLDARAAARRLRIAADYAPRHPRLWTLDAEAFLHPDFRALVREAKLSAAPRAGIAALCDGVFALPVFTPLFCRLLCEELDAFARSGLPCGRPNSMNAHGVLLDELGLSEGLLDPLLTDWLAPLCAARPELAAAGGGTLGGHKSFVVRYAMGGDEELSPHFDNSEVTLNVNIGRPGGFEAGELVFHGHRDDEARSQCPAAVHSWGDADVGHGVLHAGLQVHSALPITAGERLNLVMWLRSAAWRRTAGCPMCGGTDRLIAG